MQDVRIRAGCAAALSIAAFISPVGALAVLLWWLLFTRRRIPKNLLALAVPVIFMIAFFAAVVQFSGGNGISYAARMGVILLVGFWVFCEQQQGELLGLSVWLFGRRFGFELGLIAEMGMQSFAMLLADLERIRMAEKLKPGRRPAYANLVSRGRILLLGAMNRAEGTAELLAVRGFSGSGTFCPGFRTGPADIAAGLSALLCLGAAVLVPVSAFFILS